MDLAGEIGLSHEVLYRTLAVLEADGIITKTRSTITVKMNGAYDPNHMAVRLCAIV